MLHNLIIVYFYTTKKKEYFERKNTFKILQIYIKIITDSCTNDTNCIKFMLKVIIKTIIR